MEHQDQSTRKRLKTLEAWAERAYEAMYEAGSPAGAGAYFSEVREALREAIALARDTGLEEEASRLEKRLEHIRAVYTSQMNG
jgi:hypothetical protein